MRHTAFMTMMLQGLTTVPADCLVVLLRGLHRETLPAPLTVNALAMHGLQDYGHVIMGHLRGLERRAAVAVITAVMAERKKAGVDISKR